MKPQLYSVVILLLASINHVQNADASNATTNATASGTQPPPLTTGNIATSVAETPEKTVIVTNAPSDHTPPAPETTGDRVTPVTKTPQSNITSATKASPEATASEIPVSRVSVFSEAPKSGATPAPSVSPANTTKGFPKTTERHGGVSEATRNPNISTEKQTSGPVKAGNNTTQKTHKVTNAVHKNTEKTTKNRTSTFPLPSLFAILLLVLSVLSF